MESGAIITSNEQEAIATMLTQLDLIKSELEAGKLQFLLIAGQMKETGDFVHAAHIGPVTKLPDVVDSLNIVWERIQPSFVQDESKGE